jgi:hypothetical protein
MPKTKDHTQSVHVDLRANGLTDREALTIVNRFLSILTWCDDQFAVVQGGWSGNPVPVGVPRRNPAFATSPDWLFDRQIPPADEARRALALYREGRNAEETALVSYAVLSYFKIIEIRNPDGPRAKKWIAKRLGGLSAPPHDDPRLMQFFKDCGSEAPEDYIYTACRLAVAHASVKRPSDADDMAEIARLPLGIICPASLSTTAGFTGAWCVRAPSILTTELIFEFTTGPATGVHCITGFFAAIRRRHRSGCARRGVDSPVAVSVMFRTELDT